MTLPDFPFPIEPAAYEWPCLRCRMVFLPVIVHFPGGPHTTRYCADCRELNLLEVIFAEHTDDLPIPTDSVVGDGETQDSCSIREHDRPDV